MAGWGLARWMRLGGVGELGRVGSRADEAGEERRGGGVGSLGGEGRLGVAGGEAESLLEAAGALALAVELVVVRRRLLFLHRQIGRAHV